MLFTRPHIKPYVPSEASSVVSLYLLPSSETRLTQPQDPAGEKTTGTGTSAFSKDGAIGSKFTSEGAIGGTADKVGGPFAKDGAIG